MNAEAVTTPGTPAKRHFFQKQANMLRVLYALIPIALAGVYFFGWRVAALLGATFAAGIATEYFTSRSRHAPVSMACLVTCGLLGLSLPPTTPYWVAVVGIVVAILFGKEVFGGFGRNFANPAIVGRAFLYVCFPAELTSRFVPAFQGFPGGFAQWSFESLPGLPSYVGAGSQVADAISQATPLWLQKFQGELTPISDLFLGTIGGVVQLAGQAPRAVAAGSIGETSSLLLILCSIYLLATRTANWRLTVGMVVGILGASFALHDLAGIQSAGSPLLALFGGATMYVAVFMITDPVSAPKKPPAMLAYGLFVGIVTVLLRWRNAFAAAVSFALLMGNIIAPLLDMAAQWWQDRRKAAVEASQTQGGAA